MGVAMLKYSYQCANLHQGVIIAKSFQNTINNWSGMVNLYVPKNNKKVPPPGQAVYEKIRITSKQKTVDC